MKVGSDIGLILRHVDPSLPSVSPCLRYVCSWSGIKSSFLKTCD